MFSIDLPIRQIIPSVKQKLAERDTLIVSADPGAGKSTLLPLELLNEPWLEGKKIILLEPRRLAAMTVARRMADLLGEALGKTIGYRIRFDKKVSAQTRIEVVTEGVLTRMLQHDNALEGVGLVIFDEFHERRIHADLSLALCREAQQVLRPDLRILIMSATLDLQNLAALLGADSVHCSGRQYDVEVNYMGTMQLEELAGRCAKAVLGILAETTGDILVFLPGQAEINACKLLLDKHASNLAIHALYGQLSMQEQQKAIMPNSDGQRKIVLSTSIAETSLTIEGVKVVIDSGYTRQQFFDAKSGLSQLRTMPISRDIATQRAGRAGRLGPGRCYRLWSATDEERMAAFIKPEILEADLLPLALDLLHWGVNDAETLTWLSPPPRNRFQQALETLEQLGAVEKGAITAHGKKMHALPCHPRMGHMLLQVADGPLLNLATDMAALLEERDPMQRALSVDINLRVEALRTHRRENRSGQQFAKIMHVAAFYRQLFNLAADNTPIDPYDCGLLLSYVFPERVAQSFPGMVGRFKMANGRMVLIDALDDMAHEPWIAIAQVDARRGDGKVFLAAPISPSQVLQRAAVSDQISWDVRKGGLVAQQEWRIGTLVVDAKPLRSVPEDTKALAIIEAVKTHGKDLLQFDERVGQWQNRVACLRIWNADEEWPQVDTDTLLSVADEWLGPYLTGLRKNEDLKRLDLLRILNHWLPYERQKELELLAPEKLTVPSGSAISLHYLSGGEMPILAVRLQEVFGLLDTPSINQGKNAVVMHLLSPGYKPVQITTDLRSFWEGTYFEVRKELKRRYPKHAWPENPLEAQPLKGAVKKVSVRQ